jgi:hypothetical protein
VDVEDAELHAAGGDELQRIRPRPGLADAERAPVGRRVERRVDGVGREVERERELPALAAPAARQKPGQQHECQAAHGRVA